MSAGRRGPTSEGIAAAGSAESRISIAIIEPAPNCSDRTRMARPVVVQHSGKGRFDLAAPKGTCYVAEAEVTNCSDVYGHAVVPGYLVEERDTTRLHRRQTWPSPT